MSTQNSTNTKITNNADGFDIAGGTTARKLTLSGGDVSISGTGSAIITFPSVTSTLLYSGGALGTPASGTVTNLTGTASININGTVGATTPTTGVFTTATINTGLVPDADDGAYIGDGTHGFSDLFLASGGVINWANGNATVTHSTGALSINVPVSLGTSNALTTGTIELGNASDTTLARVSAGVVSIEGVNVVTESSTSTLTKKTIGDDMLIGENAGLKLDEALSADGKYCGIIDAGTSGEALSFGSLVYFKAADSKWWKTDANASATAGPVRLGMCVSAVNADTATKILLWGHIRADAVFPTLTIGAPAYVSETAGEIVVTQPTTADVYIRIVGHAKTADVLEFKPSNDFIQHV